MDATSTNEAARALGAQRKRVEKACVICGTVFTGLKIQRYCSETCRWREDKRKYRAKGKPASNPSSP